MFGQFSLEGNRVAALNLVTQGFLAGNHIDQILKGIIIIIIIIITITIIIIIIIIIIITNKPNMAAAYIFDIRHPCYGQLTPLKTRYPLTSIT